MAASDLDRDLGFGSVVAGQSRARLLNRDGSFNVEREGLNFFTSLSPYHALLTMSWPQFLGLIVLGYLGINLLFAGAYFACGPGALDGGDGAAGHRLLQCFFFSVQTFATIGYGKLTPTGLAPNLIVTLESLVGLLGFAIATGVLFSRVARPTARILFSARALVAPYRGITAFEFRIANGRSSQLIEVEVSVLFSAFKARDGKAREFVPLALERQKVAFFPLSWTVVHPIDPSSPIFGMSYEELLAVDAEFLILLTGFDETFSQTVHTRSSYKADEIVWGARFVNIFNPPKDGTLSIDIGRLDEFDRVPLVSALPAPGEPRAGDPGRAAPLEPDELANPLALPADRFG
jgi:inward rectifier potassium channel